jgi:hypothetical protein
LIAGDSNYQLPFNHLIKKGRIMITKFLSRQGAIVLGSLLMFSVVFTACKKNKDDVQQTPVAALMAFNLVPDQQSVQISLSGNALPGGPLAYPSYTGRYLNAYTGNRVIQSFNPATNQTLDSLSYTFEPNKYYSVFVVGANGHYKNIVAVDNYDSLTASSGKAYVRYINALSNASSSNVTISANGTNAASGNAAFGEVSAFVPVTPGDVTVNVTNEGSVNANRTISLAQHKAYTVLLTGLPNQTDSTKSVQIRFVENGTVTD